MKKKKPALTLCAVAAQAILLVFWAMLIIETVCPIYRLSDSTAIVGRDITVYAPVRVETVMTCSAEKVNNQNFTKANAQILTSFVNRYNLTKAPDYTVLEKNKNSYVYELSSSETGEKWTVTCSIGEENAFDISVSGGAK